MQARALLLLSLTVAISAGTHDFFGEYEKIWSNEKIFNPQASESFQLIRKDGVDLKYLDKTHLEGFDGQDVITLGPYSVEHRLGLITKCNKPICLQVDGILGFGNMYHDRNPTLLDTLSRENREDWDLVQAADFMPMPRRFAFTATEDRGEIQLGGYDPRSVEEGEEMVYFKGVHDDYQVKIKSITYGTGEDAVELLNWDAEVVGDGDKAVLGKLDSGTSCILMPSNTMDGRLGATSPYDLLKAQELSGVKRSLFFTMDDQHGRERTFEIAYDECVQGTPGYLLLGDPWFRSLVVDHDYRIKDQPLIGMARRAASYDLADEADEDFLESFSDDDDDHLAGAGHETPYDDAPAASPTSAGGPASRSGRGASALHHAGGRNSGGRNSGGRNSGGEIDADVGPPLALVPVAPAKAAKAGKNKGFKGDWRRESLLGMGKAAPRSFPTKIGARRFKASKEETTQLLSLMDEVPGGLPGVDKVRMEGHRVIYTIPIGIGTPAQVKNVVFDTGSYMLAVWSAPPTDAQEEQAEIHEAVGASTAGQPIRAHAADPSSDWTEELLQVRARGGPAAARFPGAWAMGASIMAMAAVVAVVLGRRRRGSHGERTPMLG
ncbi:hypothetical protein T484DRAFT_1935130 [Baffinella frigidus]|nr:hypothetical protein T484DRAFT_1935130 [Cryptophyta sp. CCMP2293]